MDYGYEVGSVMVCIAVQGMGLGNHSEMLFLSNTSNFLIEVDRILTIRCNESFIEPQGSVEVKYKRYRSKRR